MLLISDHFDILALESPDVSSVKLAVSRCFDPIKIFDPEKQSIAVYIINKKSLKELSTVLGTDLTPYNRKDGQLTLGRTDTALICRKNMRSGILQWFLISRV